MRKWTNDDRMMIACCNDGTRPVIFKIERIDIAENEEEKEWLAKQNFKNTADEIQNCYANKFSKNLVQERHDQRVIIKSYRQCMATAGCFSEHRIYLYDMDYGGDDYGNKKYYFETSY